MLSAQPPLIRDASNPLRHGARHYVPVVQSEQGEWGGGSDGLTLL